MKTIHRTSELGSERSKICLAIGFFDGVHLGHQQIDQDDVVASRSKGPGAGPPDATRTARHHRDPLRTGSTQGSPSLLVFGLLPPTLSR